MAKRIDKEKLFMIVLVVALVGIFVVLFTYGLDSVLAMEGSFPPNILEEGITPAPKTKESALDFLNKTLTDSVALKPKLETEKYFEIDSETVETSGSDQLKSLILYAIPDFDAQLDSNLNNITTDFNEEIKDKINIPAIGIDDVTDFVCDYIYYSCPSCGEESEEALPNCELCGGVYPYNMKYRDEYVITLNIAINNSTLSKNFSKRTNEEAIKLCGDTLNTFAGINKLDVNYDELKIVFKVERLTNSITYLEYSKLMSIDTDASMQGKFESLGEINTKFKITEYEKYYLTYPKLSLSESELTVEPKGTNNLLAKLTCTDPLNTVVTWKSSDESLITVDEEGYFDAANKTGSAKIIASFDFNGKTYTDECLVNVKYSVESSKMAEKDIELSVGETQKLNLTVLPKKATIKTVKWYSENEEIATVDENGVVTAKQSGVVTVYSLTDDGYFKSSCEVTVK